MQPVGNGRYRDEFTGYAFDDPAIQFATANLSPQTGELVDGAWFRFDLGRIRTGTVRLVIDALSGTEIVVALGERLFSGRVVPVVPLSTGPTCFLARYLLHGGSQTIQTLAPNGARFVEIRARTEGPVELREAIFLERDSLGPPRGRFVCGDELLETIWLTGVETLRASADDALIDPVRERGQWTGDALTVGLEVASAAYADLGLLRRALLQAAQCADAEGMVGGCIPGDVTYLGTYAAHWLSALWRYAQLTGDRCFVRQLIPAARANLLALRRRMHPDGSFRGLSWPFIDWGRRIEVERPDLALLLVMLGATRAFVSCAQFAEEPDDELGRDFECELFAHIDLLLPRDTSPDSWTQTGYHATVLALYHGLVCPVSTRAALESLRRHMQRCFPNDRTAPRLRDPSIVDERLITPAFAHYALDVLFRAGDADFVVEQWRSCWGWMLAQGATTWWEVFDDRWSHCHFWAGSPTWQMSRYLLGLWPRWDLGEGHVDLCLRVGSLRHAEGRIPFIDGHHADIAWHRDADEIAWTVIATRDLSIRHCGQAFKLAASEPMALKLTSADMNRTPLIVGQTGRTSVG